MIQIWVLALALSFSHCGKTFPMLLSFPICLTELWPRRSQTSKLPLLLIHTQGRALYVWPPKLAALQNSILLSHLSGSDLWSLANEGVCSEDLMPELPVQVLA